MLSIKDATGTAFKMGETVEVSGALLACAKLHKLIICNRLIPVHTAHEHVPDHETILKGETYDPYPHCAHGRHACYPRRDPHRKCRPPVRQQWQRHRPV